MTTVYAFTLESPTWRPRTPAVALLAVRAGVPFDDLELTREEQSLVRVLLRQGTAEDAEILLALIGYRDITCDDSDHLVALALAADELHDAQTRRPLAGPGRPRVVAEYEPLRFDWRFVERVLAWRFRAAIEQVKKDKEPEPILSLNVTTQDEDGFEIELLDHLEPVETEGGVASVSGRKRRGIGGVFAWEHREAEREQHREGTFKTQYWSVWAQMSPETREALKLKNKKGRRASPPLKKDERSEIRAAIHDDLWAPRDVEPGHARRWRRTRNEVRFVRDKLELLTALLVQGKESIERALALVEDLRIKHGDNELAQAEIDRFLESALG